MTTRTPEPWRRQRYRDMCTIIVGCDTPGYIIADVESDEHARRIVACVNACRGLPTEELEQSGLASAFGNQLLGLERRRDELLEELVITLGSLKEICDARQIPRPESTIRRAEAAIAKARA